MKTVRYLPDTVKALLRHRNMAERLRSKLEDYAADPAAFANMVVDLKGTAGKRLRVGSFRVIFEETEDEIIVTKIGPRGSVYRD